MRIAVIPYAEFKTFSKGQLHALADRLLSCEPAAVSICIEFVKAETRGLWHGRARALMCRRLKHCDITLLDQAEVVTIILSRLQTGDFSEQFKDQLRLAVRLDQSATWSACLAAANSKREHVRRYAAWALHSFRTNRS